MAWAGSQDRLGKLLEAVLDGAGSVLWVPDPGGGGPERAIVFASRAMRNVLAILIRLAIEPAPLLLLGETGTGKGLVAWFVHLVSARWRGPFIDVSCGALCEGVIESELFGHEKGSFTGAHAEKPGKFELAKGGTLFLDEIGDLPWPSQIKLLRVLQDRRFEKVGGTQTLHADVRIIAATNQNLEELVRAGKFREDLYYRLQTWPVKVPSLRERVDGIPGLARAILEELAMARGSRPPTLEPGAVEFLQTRPWSGNVRAFRSVLERALVFHRGPEIEAEDIERCLVLHGEEGVEDGGRVRTLAELEFEHIRQVLRKCGGNVPQAAVLLGCDPSTLYRKIHRHGIDV